MKKTRPIYVFGICAVTLTTGCQTAIRENIFSTINTGFGATIAQNPQTELYEIKVGYIRSQFYSIPTSKQVEGGSHTASDGKTKVVSESQLSNDPSRTPEVVSGIKMESDARTLNLGIKISENFAVGKLGVMSPAAVAMYAAGATTTNGADAAKQAVEAVTNSKEYKDNKARETEKTKAEAQIRGIYRKKPTAHTPLLNEAKRLGVVNEATTDKNFLAKLSDYADDTSDEHLGKLKQLAEFAGKQ